jgi:fluoride ion exporter CrcB/FEX
MPNAAAIMQKPTLSKMFIVAFTTFSTFSLDTLLLIQQGDIFKATINILLNVGFCIIAAALGMYIVSIFNKYITKKTRDISCLIQNYLEQT